MSKSFWAVSIVSMSFAGDLSMDGLNEMMDFMDAFTLSSNAQEGRGSSVELLALGSWVVDIC